MIHNSRYHGKPLYILLENLVLWSIGELAEVEQERFRAIEPKLREIYGRQGTWIDVLKQELALPDDFEGQVRATWQRVRAHNEEADAVSFAREFVDVRFPLT